MVGSSSRWRLVPRGDRCVTHCRSSRGAAALCSCLGGTSKCSRATSYFRLGHHVHVIIYRFFFFFASDGKQASPDQAPISAFGTKGSRGVTNDVRKWVRHFCFGRFRPKFHPQPISTCLTNSSNGIPSAFLSASNIVRAMICMWQSMHAEPRHCLHEYTDPSADIELGLDSAHRAEEKSQGKKGGRQDHSTTRQEE